VNHITTSTDRAEEIRQLIDGQPSRLKTSNGSWEKKFLQTQAAIASIRRQQRLPALEMNSPFILD